MKEKIIIEIKYGKVIKRTKNPLFIHLMKK